MFKPTTHFIDISSAGLSAPAGHVKIQEFNMSGWPLRTWSASSVLIANALRNYGFTCCEVVNGKRYYVKQ